MAQRNFSLGGFLRVNLKLKLTRKIRKLQLNKAKDLIIYVLSSSRDNEILEVIIMAEENTLKNHHLNR